MSASWPFAPLPRASAGVILADPPWRYSVRTPKGEGRSASRHYETMRLVDICALPVQELAAPHCHLFLWTTGANLEQAFEVIRNWGFKYSASGFVWVKTQAIEQASPRLFFDGHSFFKGMGHTTRKNVEFCLLGRRGNPTRLRKDIPELIVAPRREHSRKPDEQYERIEAYARGPYVELFARSQRPGWLSWGRETSRFAEAA